MNSTYQNCCRYAWSMVPFRSSRLARSVRMNGNRLVSIWMPRRYGAMTLDTNTSMPSCFTIR